jgi:hypothetical protein
MTADGRQTSGRTCERNQSMAYKTNELLRSELQKSQAEGRKNWNWYRS